MDDVHQVHVNAGMLRSHAHRHLALYLPVYRYDPKGMITECLLLCRAHGRYGARTGIQESFRLIPKGFGQLCQKQGLRQQGKREPARHQDTNPSKPCLWNLRGASSYSSYFPHRGRHDATGRLWSSLTREAACAAPLTDSVIMSSAVMEVTVTSWQSQDACQISRFQPSRGQSCSEYWAFCPASPNGP